MCVNETEDILYCILYVVETNSFIINDKYGLDNITFNELETDIHWQYIPYNIIKTMLKDPSLPSFFIIPSTAVDKDYPTGKVTIDYSKGFWP